jgi:hypothetical protein
MDNSIIQAVVNISKLKSLSYKSVQVIGFIESITPLLINIEKYDKDECDRRVKEIYMNNTTESMEDKEKKLRPSENSLMNLTKELKESEQEIKQLRNELKGLEENETVKEVRTKIKKIEDGVNTIYSTIYFFIKCDAQYEMTLNANNKEQIFKLLIRWLEALSEYDEHFYKDAVYHLMQHFKRYFIINGVNYTSNYNVTLKYDYGKKRLPNISEAFKSNVFKSETFKVPIDQLKSETVRWLRDCESIFKINFEKKEKVVFSKYYFFKKLVSYKTKYKINKDEISQIEEGISLNGSIDNNLSNFVLACLQLEKQIIFLQKWENNTSLHEPEKVKPSKKEESIFISFYNQIDICDSTLGGAIGRKNPNSDLPTMNSILKRILCLTDTDFTARFDRNKKVGSNFEERDELLIANRLSLPHIKNKQKLARKSPRRGHNNVGFDIQISDYTYWFEQSLSVYLAKAPKNHMGSELDIYEFTIDSLLGRNFIYSEYWISFMQSLRYRNFGSQKQGASKQTYLTLLDEALNISYFNRAFDAWVDKHNDLSKENYQLSPENNPFIIND